MLHALVVVFAILVAGFMVARAIEKLPNAILEANHADGSLFGLDASAQERVAVSQVAAALIAAQWSNPLYIEAMKRLGEERAAVCCERISHTIKGIGGAAIIDEQKPSRESLDRMLKDTDGLIHQNSVFRGGREKFVELAWDIYHDVCSSQSKHANSNP